MGILFIVLISLGAIWLHFEPLPLSSLLKRELPATSSFQFSSMLLGTSVILTMQFLAEFDDKF
jgi:hypothetical protein